MGASERLKFSFTTWVTPDWDIQQIIDGAHRHGYEGVELLLESDHKHGLTLDTNIDTLKQTAAQLATEGMEISAVATNIRFSDPDAAKRAEAVAHCKRYVDFAQNVGAPFIRVFGGELPRDTEVAAVVDYITESIDECLEAADGSGVSILLETHDDFANTRYVREVCKQLYSDSFGVVWDVAHPLRQLETLEESYDNISTFVRHLHVHDLRYSEDRTQSSFCVLGEGVVRMDRVIEFLVQDDFEGHLSVELMDVDPDQALPQCADGLREIISQVTGEPLSGEEPEEEIEVDEPAQA